jgi:transcriptional regulatory protein LevR/transcriptional regulator with AAA-type ATPase domain
MVTNKEQLYNFIQLHETAKGKEGVTTHYLAQALGFQRSNVSTLLGQLVAEGKLKKQPGRPVLYYLAVSPADEVGAFKNMVGYCGSLKHAVQLARAALAYPQKSLNTLLLGRRGTGKTLFAEVMYQAAKEMGALSQQAPFVEFSSLDYTQNEQGLQKEFEQAFAKAQGGVLLIDDIEMLSAESRRKLLAKIAEDNDTAHPLVLISSNESCGDNNAILQDYLPIAIELPPLAERPLAERLALIQQFVTLEAARTHRIIHMEAELLNCLMLFDCEYDIWTLKSIIKQACMNAYLREHTDTSGVLHLYISDCSPVVRKGFLNYRRHKQELEELIRPHSDYSFSETRGMNELDRAKLGKKTIYEDFDRRISDYEARGFDQGEIQTILSADMDTMFLHYRTMLVHNVVNKEQLVKLVPSTLVNKTEQFLIQAGRMLNTHYSGTTLHGLCLQVDEVLQKGKSTLAMSPMQIAGIISEHKNAYAQALLFAHELEAEFHTKVPVEEVAVMTLFLAHPDPAQETERAPALLFAFHGKGVAKTMAATIAAVLKATVSAVDIPFDEQDIDSYQKLKESVRAADKGRGVLALYDLEPLQQMFYTISLETGIEVRTLELPLTKLGISWARKATVSPSLDALYKAALGDMEHLSNAREKVIVALCTTSEGFSAQIKIYLEQHATVHQAKVVSLSLSDRGLLREKLQRIMQTSVIQCIVGTYDPQLLAIPFVPASAVLGASEIELARLLSLERPNTEDVEINEVYQYLTEHLEAVEVDKLRQPLQEALEKLAAHYEFSLGTQVGLMVHIACAVNRLAGKGITPANPRKEEILGRYKADYKYLRATLVSIEKRFHVILPDDEFANILTILYQL